MPVLDQCVWASCSIATAPGEVTAYKRGDLLPPVGSDEEAAQRTLLRLGGALRVVEVVYTAEELAEQATARGEQSAAAAVAHDVDPAVPMEQQAHGEAEAGLPTLTTTHGNPVVIGDEDLRAAHEQQAAAAEQAAAERAAKPPAVHAAKREWVAFAVDQRGVSQEDAEAMTRDALVDAYREPPDGD